MIPVMKRLLTRTLLALGLAGAVNPASAFTPLGPYSSWETTTLGYNLSENGDVGGPQNLHEEYRWNVPYLYYGFDSSFKNYFGQRGMDAVRQAFAVLNNLPPFSQMSSNLAEYPLDTRHYNYQAAALGLLDMKTFTLGFMMEELGLASPERYIFTLRAITTVQTTTYYLVVKRNYDPVTLDPSSYVNGVLYTYLIVPNATINTTTFSDAVEFPVDPLAFTYNALASMFDGLWGGGYGYGQFVTGLTRDDVGGLRYLYAGTGPYVNYNVEDPITGVTGGGSLSPWMPVGGTNTNSVVTTALRPGVDKLRFIEAQFDSILGSFVTITNSYTDNYVTNSQLKSQSVQRTISQPDILFVADDVGLTTGGTPVTSSRTDTSGWTDNASANGQAALNGPGVIPGQVVITYNNIGQWLLNETGTGISYLDEASASTGWSWAIFDGTTNAPVIFPLGTTVQDLEMQVTGGQ